MRAKPSRRAPLPAIGWREWASLSGFGSRVCKVQGLGIASDPFGGGSTRIRATTDGLPIGHTSDPLAHRGDAILHLAVDV